MASKSLKPPRKLGVPILLQFSIVFWGVAAFVYINAPQFLEEGKFKWAFKLAFIDEQNLIWFCCGVAFLTCILVAIMAWRAGSISTVHITALAICIGLSLSLVAASNIQTQQNNALSLKSDEYKIYVLEDQRQGSYNITTNAELFEDGTKYKVKLQWSDCDFEIHAGDHIKAHCTLSKPSDTQSATYWQNGQVALVKASNIHRDNISTIFSPIFAFRNHLIQTIRDADIFKADSYSEAEQLLAAIICGQRIDLNSGDLYTSFKNTGLAHLVAVSGAHLSLVTSLLVVVLKRLRTKKWMAIIIQSVFILAYLVCAAVPISALRSAFMTYVALFAFFGRRRPAPLNALGICIATLIAINPQTAVSVSFALSASSTIGIILFANLLDYWIHKGFPRCPDFISGALAMTFSANICALPLSISIFGQLPLISPISNIVCTPVFTVLCAAGMVVCVTGAAIAALIPALANYLIMFGLVISSCLAWIVRFLSNLPYACIEASLNTYIAISITLVISWALLHFWPRRKIKEQFQMQTHDVKLNATDMKPTSSKIAMPHYIRKRNWIREIVCVVGVIAIAFLVSTFIKLPTGSDTQIIMLDIGQGDSVVIKSKGATYMIDTGCKDDLLRSRLSEEGITHLDGLFITHPDNDHCGSIQTLASCTKIDKFYCAKDMTTCSCSSCTGLISKAKNIVGDANICTLNVGDKIDFGEVDLSVIWPDSYQDEGGNGDSLTMIGTFDINNDNVVDATALFCGDAEWQAIESMQSKNRLGSIDIYKVGHHGSKNALSDKSAEILQPKISLFSVGAGNTYGHPTQKTLTYCQNYGQVYRTDTQGTITCNIRQNSVDVKTSK